MPALDRLGGRARVAGKEEGAVRLDHEPLARGIGRDVAPACGEMTAEVRRTVPPRLGALAACSEGAVAGSDRRARHALQRSASHREVRRVLQRPAAGLVCFRHLGAARRQERDVVFPVDAASTAQTVAEQAIHPSIAAAAPLHLTSHVGVDQEPSAPASIEVGTGDRVLAGTEPAAVAGTPAGAAMLADL